MIIHHSLTVFYKLYNFLHGSLYRTSEELLTAHITATRNTDDPDLEGLGEREQTLRRDILDRYRGNNPDRETEEREMALMVECAEHLNRYFLYFL